MLVIKTEQKTMVVEDAKVSIAQSAEQLAVNQPVLGSSPSGNAINLYIRNSA